MEFKFLIEIPEDFVDLNVANNYRQETERVSEKQFEVKLKNYPKIVFEKLNQEVDIKNWPRFLEGVKDSIETYEDLFYVIKDYIHWKIKTEYKDVNSPFAYFYKERWNGGCNTYNGLFKEILENLGFEVRLVGGLILNVNSEQYYEKIKINARHVWLDVKINNTWIELDATSRFLLPSFFTVRLFDIRKKLKFEIEEWLKKKFKVFIY